jgi:hypothetical protein
LADASLRLFPDDVFLQEATQGLHDRFEIEHIMSTTDTPKQLDFFEP